MPPDKASTTTPSKMREKSFCVLSELPAIR
jgi:hypothetical protein